MVETIIEKIEDVNCDGLSGREAGIKAIIDACDAAVGVKGELPSYIVGKEVGIGKVQCRYPGCDMRCEVHMKFAKSKDFVNEVGGSTDLWDMREKEISVKLIGDGCLIEKEEQIK